MRKRNLTGFIIVALIVHIVLPLILGNKELYFFAMPLPWGTTTLQLLYPDSSFYQSHFPIWGAAGISAALVFSLCISAVVVIGTLLFGRRWQCSTLCMFNGWAAEVFEPAIPIIGKVKKVRPGMLKFLNVLRWLFLAISIFFTAWWALFLLGISVPGNSEIISQIEIYKYLGGELLIMIFFWVAFIGRGYCYYCPLGTVLGLLSKAARQKIITNNTECIQCNLCNNVCPMTIDIKSRAITGQPVNDLRCVGCGHCIDSCPTGTLSYTTWFLQKFTNTSGDKKSN